MLLLGELLVEALHHVLELDGSKVVRLALEAAALARVVLGQACHVSAVLQLLRLAGLATLAHAHLVGQDHARGVAKVQSDLRRGVV